MSRKERRKQERELAKQSRNRGKTPPVNGPEQAKGVSWGGAWGMTVFFVALTLACTLPFIFKKQVSEQVGGREQPSEVKSKPPQMTLDTLKELPAKEIEKMDLALLNLVVGNGLPGIGTVDISDHLRDLDRITEAVRRETRAGLNSFKADPGRFENSEELFKMAVMAAIVQNDSHYTIKIRSQTGCFNHRMNEYSSFLGR